MSSKCECCYGPIKAIGSFRKNGRRFITDWNDRKYHIKCYNKVKLSLYKERLDQLTKEGDTDKMYEVIRDWINHKIVS